MNDYVSLASKADELAARQSVGTEVVLVQASGLKPEAVSWAWQGYLPYGKLSILAGPPGVGKTAIMISIAATVSAGGRWPDGSRAEVGTVLVWSGEYDPADTLLPRLLAAGADASRGYFVKATREAGETRPFDPATDMVQLATQAAALDAKMLLVDPVVSAIVGDSHKNAEVRRGLQPLVDLAAALGAAVVGISHFGKGTAGRDPVDRVAGSLAFGALPRMVLAAVRMRSEDGDRRVFTRAKTNIAQDGGGFGYGVEQIQLRDYPEIETSVVRWGEPLEGSARELLAEAEEDADEGQTPDADEFLAELLKAGRIPGREVLAQMKAEGYTEKVTRRARERLGVVVQREGFGSAMRSVWSLPFVTASPSRAQSRPLTERAGMGGNDGEGTNEPTEVF